MPSPGSAQAPLPPDSGAGASLRVSLVTIGPGAAIWERFGHNAILVRDTASGLARAYNYGLFSFRQENFLLRFAQGRMQYWMAGFDGKPHIDEYVAAGRSVWVQDLNLTAAQRLALSQYLTWNEHPENAFYRYHYYSDNCSTRVRDALDGVLNGRIRIQTATDTTTSTYRSHTRRLTRDDLLVYTGLMLGLGQPVDRRLTSWDEMFLPLKLRDRVREISVPGPGGRLRPLVAAEMTVHEGVAEPEGDDRVFRYLGFFAIGLGLAALVTVIGHLATRHGAARAAFAVIATGWGVLLGAAGVVLVGLWAWTDHSTSYWNENLFLLNPVWLLVGVLAPATAWRGTTIMRTVGWAGVVGAGLSLGGFALQALPGFDQVNGQVYALFLLPNLAVATGMVRLAELDLSEGRRWNVEALAR